MDAAAVMNPNPTVLESTDTIHKAVEYIMAHRYRNLPVVDERGRYLGIFGVTCLIRMVLPKAVMMNHGLENVSFIHATLPELHAQLQEVDELPVTDCMITDIETVRPTTALVEVLKLLYQNRNSIPVVDPDNGRLLGMISYWDVGEKILSA